MHGPCQLQKNPKDPPIPRFAKKRVKKTATYCANYKWFHICSTVHRVADSGNNRGLYDDIK